MTIEKTNYECHSDFTTELSNTYIRPLLAKHMKNNFKLDYGSLRNTLIETDESIFYSLKNEKTGDYIFIGTKMSLKEGKINASITEYYSVPFDGNDTKEQIQELNETYGEGTHQYIKIGNIGRIVTVGDTISVDC